MASLQEKSLGRTGVEISLQDLDTCQGSIVVGTKNGKAYIGYINVKPGYQGNGIGSTLLLQAETWARRQGFLEICGTLIPVPGSEQAMKQLMGRNGYTIDKKGNIHKNL